VRGADALTAALAREGVEVVFGVPGGACLPIYDALAVSPIRHVLMRHEAAAGHAAEGFARATGRVGVALATSGPGATNLLTALADADMDSTPVVFVCGQVRTDLRGTQAFQEADILGMAAPAAKHVMGVDRADDVAQAVRDAFHVASSGRPGPVLLEIPVDVQKAPARDRPTHAPSLPGLRTHASPHRGNVRAAARLLAAATRPVLYVGGGVVHAGAQAELAALADLTGAPVTTTLMALGAFPASDPRWLGMLGMHGTRVANRAVDECDVLVALGARFDDRVTGDVAEFAPHARVIHVDVEPSEIGKIVAADIPIVGDARRALSLLADEVTALAPEPARLTPWWELIDSWRDDHPQRPHPGTPPEGTVAPEMALDVLRGALEDDAIVTTDVGQHQMWAASRLGFDTPRRWLTSGGLGTMGFGLPAALGAQAACPDKQVVCVTGDGSLLMAVQELATAVEERLPVKVVLLDNAALGMVRQQQDLFWGGRRHAVSLGAWPDWEALAAAFGVAVRSTGDQDDVAHALRETLDEPGPALLHVRIPAEADCLPMVPPGAPARAMIG
jgi:acetolactate synthase I/II/III large subunit